MAEILLTSERFVKEVTTIHDNVDGKYLQSAIRESQDIALRSVIGTALLNSLKAKVGAGTIRDAAFAAYKALLDECQYYLAYTAVVSVMQHVDYKVANAGVVKTPDQNVVTATDEERDRKVEFYQAKADACCYQLQIWVLDHRTDYPELDECACRSIKSNLYSAATCGIFLGGPRGKGYGRTCR